MEVINKNSKHYVKINFWLHYNLFSCIAINLATLVGIIETASIINAQCQEFKSIFKPYLDKYYKIVGTKIKERAEEESEVYQIKEPYESCQVGIVEWPIKLNIKHWFKHLLTLVHFFQSAKTSLIRKRNFM